MFPEDFEDESFRAVIQRVVDENPNNVYVVNERDDGVHILAYLKETILEEAAKELNLRTQVNSVDTATSDVV